MRVCALLQEFFLGYQGKYFMKPNCIFIRVFLGIRFCSLDVQLGGTRLDLWNCYNSPLCAQQTHFHNVDVQNGRRRLHIDNRLISDLKKNIKEEWIYAFGDSCKKAIMYKIPLQLLEDGCLKDKSWNNAPNSNKLLIGAIRAYLLMLLVCKLPELSLCASVAASKAEHEGFCPNKLNSNLWVDAQSTCERECNVDEDCADFEKCCTNVCGLNSCVAARFSDGTPAQPDGQVGVEGSDAPASTATCEGFLCTQQGATCAIWDGQPICKCQDRCEKEPNFTCASDGLTYFNRCYMDAEACVRGVSLTVVACRFYLAGPNTSPLPQDITTNPTPTSSQEDPGPPTLYSNPHHQSTYVGGTVSFHCDVVGAPRPDVTWEKQSDRRERLIMRPDQMYGNVVITNIGQLVIYNAQVWDTGIYTCIARNSAGVLRAEYPLSVIRRSNDDFSEDPEMPMGRPFSPADCLHEVDLRVCSGERHVDWYYDNKLGSCMAFSNGGCDDSRNRFETYEECQASCQREGIGICSLPAVQGTCKSWEPRWAWNSLLKECQGYVYGGCHGNANSFSTKKECEANCPQPKRKPCKTCRVKGKMVPSLCRSDFAIVGRLTELVEDLDSGLARFSLEEVLRDEKMGLTFFNTKHLEVTVAKIDWSCPCPNITMEENPLLVMGVVQDGIAIIQSDSYVRAISERRLKKLREVLNKKTCEVL